MGRVNIRAKAKLAASKAAAGVQQKINQPKTEDKEKLLLHKTITPKKTITKREKFRQKHKKLMNKFVQLKKQRKEENARKNREKTAVIGDLKPLKDALPSLDELYKLSKQNRDIRTGVKDYDEKQQVAGETTEQKNPSVKQKLRQKKEKFIKKVNSYHKLLKDPDFKKNPRDVIAYHVKYTNGLIDD